ncbi:MAG: ABC transporter permease [Candidatus Aminicenantes bacterium]|nr:ABC transporter permease [Candidatus Aminicenantes bacterium]MDH5743313.1 ABC transporter permease [Candidatus Aminicenantes bacterium]
MRIFPLFKKAMIENFRDWKILIMGLTFAPFFVVLMYFYFGEAVESYRVLFINHDQGVITKDGNPFNAGQALVSEMMKIKYSDGTNMLKVSQEEELAEAQKRLKKKSVDVIVEIPENFSQILMDYKEGKRPDPAVVKTYGDPANAKYMMAAAWSDSITYQFTVNWTGLKGPLQLETESLSQLKSLTDFDLYVPGLLALALMMLMFTAAATLIKEKDKGTLVRLRISNMVTSEWLLAVSLTQVIIGLLAVGLTYLTAVMFGYQTEGSLMSVTVVCVLSCVAMIAISFLVAALLRTIFDLMTIGCFPFFILMFFSGGMFPIPALKLFVVGGYTINVNDILPTSHSIGAMNKILNRGAGIGEVGFEMGAIVILSIVYFAAGIWLFTRRHMHAN